MYQNRKKILENIVKLIVVVGIILGNYRICSCINKKMWSRGL